MLDVERGGHPVLIDGRSLKVMTANAYTNSYSAPAQRKRLLLLRAYCRARDGCEVHDTHCVVTGRVAASMDCKAGLVDATEPGESTLPVRLMYKIDDTVISSNNHPNGLIRNTCSGPGNRAEKGN
jgi:hypothetical protein